MQLVNIYGGVMTYFAGSSEDNSEELPEIIFNNGTIEFLDSDNGNKCGGFEDEQLLKKNWDMFKDLGFESVGTISIDTSKYGSLEEEPEEKEEDDIKRGLVNIAGNTINLAEAAPVAGLLTEFADDAVLAVRAAVIAAAHEDMSDEVFDSFMGDYPEEIEGSYEDIIDPTEDDLWESTDSFNDDLVEDHENDHEEVSGGSLSSDYDDEYDFYD